MGDLSGQTIRGYQLRELIGVGGVGAVYRAHQPSVGREVAIKVILSEYANQPDFIRRFDAEAQFVARLEHPHIVPLYDYWREPDGAYLIMRYLRGGSLRQGLARGAWPPEEAALLLDQIAGALAIAHRQGVVHRDVKPENIMLDEERNAYLSDFGIAKELGRAADEPDEEGVSGSLAYISPEQAQGLPVVPQTDQYSLGVVLYETLTGAHPFPGASPTTQLRMHLTEPLPPLRVPGLEGQAALEAVLQRATAKSPSERYPDLLTFANAFRQAITSGTVSLVMPEWIAQEVVNPYKGLRAFEEADVADFFGREALTEQLLARLADPTVQPRLEQDAEPPEDGQRAGRTRFEDVGGLGRFLAVVGPSGSGKSSVVRAGLVPALRRGALPGSDKWFIVEMVPGPQPLNKMEAALRSVALRPAAQVMEQLRSDPRGLVSAVENVLSDLEGDLLLVIDQFEEVFTLLEGEDERAHLLELVRTAVTDPHSRVRVLVTLRADFYDRPLLYEGFGRLMQAHTKVVLPMSSDEIERAITGPAARVGVSVDADFVAAVVADVREEPGALPLLQYALTEVFERRPDGGRTLTLEAYRASGGVLGALARRAEEVYAELGLELAPIARQLFLRLVTLGEGAEDTRRRARRSELMSLGNPDAVTAVLDSFGEHRLLTFDVELGTREPMVEVAHEALIWQWNRLRDWLDASRADVRLQRLLAAAVAEWEKSGREPSFLLGGARLSQFVSWAAATELALTLEEQAYLDASILERERHVAEEQTRQQREREAAQKLAKSEKLRAEEHARTMHHVKPFIMGMTAEEQMRLIEDQARELQRLRQQVQYMKIALIVAGVMGVVVLLGVCGIINLR